MNAEDKIKKSKIELIINQPFFGVIVNRLQYISDESIPTAATNGLNIRYNPKFIDTLNLTQCIGLIAHEILHIVMLHMLRKQNRDHYRWNVAADYVINLLLQDFAMPEGVLLDQKYADMSAEEVYNILPEDCKTMYVSWGDVTDAINNDESLSETEKELLEKQVKSMLVEAGTVARMAGKLPDSMERVIGEFIKSKVDWKEVLHSFVSERARDDYSFKKCNTRFAHTGFYLPSLYSEKMKPILLGIDTSGSINNEMLKKFSGHIEAIQEQHNVDIQVLYIDSDINKEEYFEASDKLQLVAVGGGGTDFRPLFDWYDNADEEYSSIIYLTDMEGTFPEVSPDIPVLWVTDNKKAEAPFGIKVIFDDKD